MGDSDSLTVHGNWQVLTQDVQIHGADTNSGVLKSELPPIFQSRSWNSFVDELQPTGGREAGLIDCSNKTKPKTPLEDI